MNVFTEKIREVFFSVLPVTLIVLIFNLTVTPLGFPLLMRFLFAALLITVGLAIFLIGVDLAITPLGSLTGENIIKKNNLWILLLAGVILGFFISVAEPGLLVLANQVALVTAGHVSDAGLVIVVSVGLGVLMATGFARIVYNVPLNKTLTGLYILTFVLALITKSEFLAIAFDASGATTGVMAVPFILALGMGVSAMKKDSKASEKDSFGLVAITSVGAILGVQLMSIFSGTKELGDSLHVALSTETSFIRPFLEALPGALQETFFVLLPLFVIFLTLQQILFKLNKKAFSRILKGFVYTFAGLVVFFTGVNAVFMDAGSMVGYKIAGTGNNFLIIVTGFFLGFTTILAEPAVHILTHQIEDVTSGYVKGIAVLGALALGVGIAVALSMLRILLPGFQLWHFLLPGFIIAIGMSYFVPQLFVGIAFDAGGVATGPITATFILAFTQGVAEAVEGASVLIDGFGMIAAVALLPIITLQLLGLIFQIKTRKGGVEPDEE
ncbi:MAG TPA: DUF1538 domain-containing protein [Firmicutes bacterium]|nr:DUF1538 domain-containing protein [Bacillota bacterium]